MPYRRHFRRHAPELAAVVRRVGPFTLRPQRNRFQMLVRSIVFQQISMGAARTIYSRLEVLAGPQGIQPQAVAENFYKLVDSAAANAETTEGLDRSTLVITTVMVDEGPTMKRWRPRAKGAANRILKRTSHLTVVVTDEK